MKPSHWRVTQSPSLPVPGMPAFYPPTGSEGLAGSLLSMLGQHPVLRPRTPLANSSVVLGGVKITYRPSTECPGSTGEDTEASLGHRAEGTAKASSTQACTREWDPAASVAYLSEDKKCCLSLNRRIGTAAPPQQLGWLRKAMPA